MQLPESLGEDNVLNTSSMVLLSLICEKKTKACNCCSSRCTLLVLICNIYVICQHAGVQSFICGMWHQVPKYAEQHFPVWIYYSKLAIAYFYHLWLLRYLVKCSPVIPTVAHFSECFDKQRSWHTEFNITLHCCASCTPPHGKQERNSTLLCTWGGGTISVYITSCSSLLPSSD